MDSIKNPEQELRTGSDMEIKTVILCNGVIRSYCYAKRAIKRQDYIICADGGIAHAQRLGVIPNLLIGDMDSCDLEQIKKKYANIKIERYPREKDQTDTQLCVQYAIEMGSAQVVVLGGLGGRLDHTMANIFLLRELASRGIKCCIKELEQDVYVIGPKSGWIEISKQIGQNVSLLPLDGKVEGVSCKGLQYPLNGDTMYMSSPRGISNVFVESSAQIKIEEGYLAIMC